MKLNHLLKGLNYISSKPLDENDVTAVIMDSRQVTPGSLFIALKPLNGSDGIPHILEAIQKGARYILKDQNVKLDMAIPESSEAKFAFIEVSNARKARTHIAANIFPGQPEKVVAVTGTNGKTSTVTFLRQIWELCGLQAASIGTLGIQSNVSLDDIPQSSFSTPDPFILHETLYKLAQRHVTHAAMEAASQGLDQYRVENTSLTAAAFTNLSHEHLDYHLTMDQYFAAKARLFSEVLPDNSAAILNADDFRFKTLSDICRAKNHNIITYGREAKDIKLVDATITEKGQDLILKIFDRRYQVSVPLMGMVQGYNIMTAIGLALACGLEIEQILSVLPKLKSTPGRFDRIGQHPSGGMVYVDYAHKPHALETVLTSLRPHVKGRLSVVFGCGGDRDTQKRPMMGEIAALHADEVIITDDNPRTEDAMQIRQQILSHCPDALEIPDRAQAIRTALHKLEKHDVCVIAGKGHEQGQIVGDKILPFDDREIAQAELKKLGGIVF